MNFGNVFRRKPRLSREQEADLITRLQNGERELLNELFDSCANYIFTVCRSRTKTELEAEELFSSLYEDIVEAFYKFDVSRNVRLYTYLNHIIGRRANRYYAYNTEEVLMPSEEMRVLDGSCDAVTDSLRDEFVSHVYDFLATIPEDMRFVVNCSKEGMSNKQIAAELSVRRGKKMTIPDVVRMLEIIQNDLLVHLRHVGMCDREYVGDIFDKKIVDFFGQS
jgi:RNA polymerase sigma factor (sigma-70 family)